MSKPITLAQLKDAIRKAKTQEDLLDLHRLVGPSAEELANAKSRLAQMDALESTCCWVSTCPTRRESEARERWNAIMAVQQAYEAKYC